MDAEQQAVIRHGSGPLLVLGGPRTRQTVSLPERLAAPADARARADAQHLSGWPELAAFYGRCLRVRDDEEAVAFAGLVEQAAAAAEVSRGQPLFDHLLVDDYQDATFSAERLLAELGAETLVAAGDPPAHLFSLPGTTGPPIPRVPHLLPTAGTGNPPAHPPHGRVGLARPAPA